MSVTTSPESSFAASNALFDAVRQIDAGLLTSATSRLAPPMVRRSFSARLAI